jgi:dihydroorotase
VCHISTKESVDIIRKAKAEGVDVTCETAPHYLLLDDSMLEEDGKWKMNPPIRSKADREALIEGLLDGTIDCIATDHAPHSAEEKSRGLEKSAFGIVGIETAFPLLHKNKRDRGLSLCLSEIVSFPDF